MPNKKSRRLKSDKSLVEYYDKKYLLDVCGGGEEFLNGGAHQRFFRAIKLANVEKDDNVLDVGGGRGEIALLLSRNNIKTTVIDYSEDAIALVNEALKSAPNKELVTTRVMDVMNLCFTKNSFDKIFFLEVLEHLTIDEGERAISEMLRVLKPHGCLVISTSPNRLLTDILIATARFIKPNLLWKSRAYHINEQTYLSLRKTVKGCRLPYKIHCQENRQFFYGQIIKNQQIGNGVKNLIWCFNVLYDFSLFRMIRKLPILNKLFCTSYLVEIHKR